MPDVVNRELAARFESHVKEPDHREAVIVTSEQPIDPETLAATGMEVIFVSGDGRIASGTVDRGGLDQVVALEGVTRVEADTEMHALGD